MYQDHYNDLLSQITLIFISIPWSLAFLTRLINAQVNLTQSKYENTSPSRFKDKILPHFQTIWLSNLCWNINPHLLYSSTHSTLFKRFQISKLGRLLKTTDQMLIQQHNSFIYYNRITNFVFNYNLIQFQHSWPLLTKGSF